MRAPRVKALAVVRFMADSEGQAADVGDREEKILYDVLEFSRWPETVTSMVS